MTELTSYQTEDRVAVITIDNPPVNALGEQSLRALAADLERAEADPKAKVIVICAAGRTWPAGADIRELGKAGQGQPLPDLCERLAQSAKPVIVALHGTVLGGGLELALAAQFRIAAPTAHFGFPEVTLGLLPGAGGTQRLPRLVGPVHALSLMLSGRPIAADQALQIGLIDHVSTGAPLDAALALARDLARGAPLPRVRDREAGLADSARFLAAIAEARAAIHDPRLPAPARIIDCVEAALLLPMEAGLVFERAAFDDLLASPQSEGLRHAFLAEKRAARQPDLRGLPSRRLDLVGVVGGGHMGSGIASALLSAGLSVTLVERDAAALSGALARIAGTHERAVAKGALTAEAREEEWSRISGATSLNTLVAADLVLEAIPEDLPRKTALFESLGAIVSPGTILATNTSYLDVNVLAAASRRPQDVLGLHFFSPAHVMRVVEVIAADKTAPDVIATAFDLVRRMRKVAVRAGACEGFIGNRVMTACRTACDYLLEDGASPYEIDRALVGFGFPLGPYQVLDMAGLDISWQRRKRHAPTRDPAERYVAIADRFCEAGRFGQKAGRGFYRYEGGSHQAIEDPDALAIIEAERDLKGVVARPVPAQEIRTRTIAAMANEGTRLLEEGHARCPSDIDAVVVLGLGFPRWRGGPMLVADRIGALAMRNQLRAYAREDPSFWSPSPLWDDLVKYGRHFSDMNTA